MTTPASEDFARGGIVRREPDCGGNQLQSTKAAGQHFSRESTFSGCVADEGKKISPRSSLLFLPRLIRSSKRWSSIVGRITRVGFYYLRSSLAFRRLLPEAAVPGRPCSLLRRLQAPRLCRSPPRGEPPRSLRAGYRGGGREKPSKLDTYTVNLSKKAAGKRL